MADLVDMKRTPAEKKRDSEPIAESMDDYGYGLSLHLDNEAIAKLGLTDADIDVEQPMMLVAACIVSSENISTVGGKRRRSMSLQIQKMGLSQETPRASPGEVLFSDR